MRPAVNCAFSTLEDFSDEPEAANERHQRELEARVAGALEQGYQRGYEAGRSEAQSTYDAHLSDLTLSFNSDAAAREAAWQSETGSVLAESLRAQLDDISEMLERHIAALIKPLVKGALYRDALQQFHEALESIVEKGIAIEIRGTSDLVRGAEERLPPAAKAVTFVTSDDAAIEIKCDETTISANFADWSRRLEEAVV